MCSNHAVTSMSAFAVMLNMLMRRVSFLPSTQATSACVSAYTGVNVTFLMLIE